MTYAYLKNNQTQEMELVHFSEFMTNPQDYDEIMAYYNTQDDIDSLTDWTQFLIENYDPIEDDCINENKDEK